MRQSLQENLGASSSLHPFPGQGLTGTAADHSLRSGPRGPPGGPTALRPRAARWGHQAPLTADEPVPRPPTWLCPGGWGPEMQTLGPTSPATGKITGKSLPPGSSMGWGGGGGRTVHTYPVAPQQAPASRSPRQPAGPQTARVREGQGGEGVLGTAMANLESSLSHGELRPSAPDASECVGRGSGTEPSRGSRSSPGPPRPSEPAHSLLPRPPTLNALCIQLLLLSRFSRVRLCVTP